MTIIYKAIRLGLFYNKQRYIWDTYGSMFFDKGELIQHLTYASKCCGLTLDDAEIIEYNVVEVKRHQFEFPPEVQTGESFENIS